MTSVAMHSEMTPTECTQIIETLAQLQNQGISDSILEEVEPL